MNRPLLLSATALLFVIGVDRVRRQAKMTRPTRSSRRSAPPRRRRTTSTTLNTNRIFYTVKQGDFLSNIAESFDVPVQAIVELNGLADPNDIQAGQTIEIPTGVVLVADLPTTTTPTATT